MITVRGQTEAHHREFIAEQRQPEMRRRGPQLRDYFEVWHNLVKHSMVDQEIRPGPAVDQATVKMQSRVRRYPSNPFNIQANVSHQHYAETEARRKNWLWKT